MKINVRLLDEDGELVLNKKGGIKHKIETGKLDSKIHKHFASGRDFTAEEVKSFKAQKDPVDKK